ncbi:2'-5' RNA ligase family protein [Arthrobacter mobilis]|uniref:2'-5' RNA ligase family protein n=1 Tax=Arthrobacter mobilis TaxID=2724944 RepID=A0A7X6K5A4_9MICC|nr:2'-5' RNA ligase family protein [Arthrobacter mobilis]
MSRQFRDSSIALQAGIAGLDAPEPAAAVGLAGVVIGIPEPMATELENWRASFGDPLAAVIPPHITLVTTTPVTDWDAAAEHVRQVAREQAPFTVTMQGTGTFRPVSPVVYVNVSEGFDSCVELHRKLQSGPLARDLEFEFHPHVTVAHGVSHASMDAAEYELAGYTASFTVSSMGLYEHDPSGVWILREELSFDADAGPGAEGR